MRSLVICLGAASSHPKIASAIAEALDAELKTPAEMEGLALDGYDLIGIGPWAQKGNARKSLEELVTRLPETRNGVKAFIFSSGGKPDPKLKKRLEQKGYEIVDEFCCRGKAKDF